MAVLALVLPGLAVASVTENEYASRSDAELTALAADWDSLDRHQRRALLTEMKLRMARGVRGKGNGEGVLHIRTERRYGRIIRQSDGRVIRIETQVVHVRPISPEEVESRRSFGVGFEQRVGRRQESAEDAEPGREADDSPSPEDEVLTNVLDALEPALEPDPPLSIYPVADPSR